MASRTYKTIKRADLDIVRAFESIADEHGIGRDVVVVIDVTDGEHQLQAKLSGLLEHASIGPIFEEDSPLLHRLVLQSGNHWQVLVERGDSVDTVRVELAQPRHLDTGEALKVLRTVSKFIPPFGRTSAVDEVLGAELSEFYQRREAAVLRLEEIHQKSIEEMDRYRKRLDDQADERRAALEVKFERDAEAVRAEYERLTNDLDKREKALADRAAAVDSASSRDARRQIRKDLKASLANREKSFTLSDSTQQKRWPIMAMFVALAGVSIYSLAVSYQVGLTLPDNSINWANSIRTAISGLALGATVIYAIRWADLWFRQHAEEEFRLKRLDLDIDRASWVVEMAMEWKRETDGDVIPAAIIDGVTRNLVVVQSDGRSVTGQEPN